MQQPLTQLSGLGYLISSHCSAHGSVVVEADVVVDDVDVVLDVVEVDVELVVVEVSSVFTVVVVADVFFMAGAVEVVVEESGGK